MKTEHIYACGRYLKPSGFSRCGNTVQARRAKALRAFVARRPCKSDDQSFCSIKSNYFSWSSLANTRFNSLSCPDRRQLFGRM
jgi:hypothetical protein